MDISLNVCAPLTRFSGVFQENKIRRMLCIVRMNQEPRRLTVVDDDDEIELSHEVRLLIS